MISKFSVLSFLSKNSFELISVHPETPDVTLEVLS
ncbi:hypothetical protein SBDP1_1440004 [Syntrophobacter sp. SbD1]|nr:hypothetical protein SBDP1_1440004 [Syntrophobacter sp. SbD1]